MDDLNAVNGSKTASNPDTKIKVKVKRPRPDQLQQLSSDPRVILNLVEDPPQPGELNHDSLSAKLPILAKDGDPLLVKNPDSGRSMQNSQQNHLSAKSHQRDNMKQSLASLFYNQEPESEHILSQPRSQRLEQDSQPRKVIKIGIHESERPELDDASPNYKDRELSIPTPSRLMSMDQRIINFLRKAEVSHLIANPHTLREINRFDAGSSHHIDKNSLTPSSNKPSRFQRKFDLKAAFLGTGKDEGSEMKLNPDRDDQTPENSEFARHAHHGDKERSTGGGRGHGGKRRKSRSRIGSILLPAMNVDKPMPENSVIEQINGYLPICLYLAQKLGFKEEADSFRLSVEGNHKRVKIPELEHLMENMAFLELLIERILKYEEGRVFNTLIKDIKSLNFLLTNRFMNLFEVDHRYEYLLEFFSEYERFLVVASKTTPRMGNLATISQNSMNSDRDGNPALLTREKLIIFIKNYMLCTQSNDLLMRVFKHLGTGHDGIVNLFMDAGEEDRFIWMATKDDALIRFLDSRVLVEKQLFKTLVLLDPVELIDVFNQDIGDEKNWTVYYELCKRIGEGIEVEALCNVIIQVHNTFWDMDKLPNFYKALNKVFSNKTSYSEEEHSVIANIKDSRNDNKENWLVFVQNPLLFCIKLVYFFQKLKEQLDFKTKEITDLSESLMSFCISYCVNSSPSERIVNFFDKDSQDRDFLEYAFLVENMKLLETEAIEGLIYEMWDLARHTMQTINQFMRLSFMSEDVRQFNMHIFTKTYEMPIEENDSFQMEFRYTSNSIFIRVLSEIVWTISILTVEFILSIEFVRIYKNFEFGPGWFTNYFERAGWLAYAHAALRGSYIVSLILKTALMHRQIREGFFHLNYYYLLFIFYFLQMVLFPALWADNFWLLLNFQAAIFLIQVGYAFYLGLSLNFCGIDLRIFLNLVFVVLIFGTVSCFVILLIAFPLHAIYVDFSQVVDGQLFPQMNMFSSLYNGVLTLFEFVFGAVVFVRPYLYQDWYTYSITFIMVIFSFFGNIMLANMLVAFLTRQFEQIRRRAKYFTLRMQFGLIKMLNIPDLDSMYNMPYPFIGLALPFYLFMLKPGPTRNKVNILLRKFIHVVNIFIPTFCLVQIYLIYLIAVRYLEMLLFVFVRAPVRPIYIVYFFVWLIGGPFLLLKLYVQDVCTMVWVMLNFNYNGEGMLSTDISDEAKAAAIEAFNKIYKTALHHLSESKVSIGHFLMYMGLTELNLNILKVVQTIKFSENFGESMSHKDDAQLSDMGGDKEGGASQNGFASKLTEALSADQTTVVKLLLKKFATKSNLAETRNNVDDTSGELDLKFMVDKLKNNINMENIAKLIGFDKNTLNKASKYIGDNDKEVNVKNELERVHYRVESLDKKITSAMDELKDFLSSLLAKKAIDDLATME